MKRPVLVLFGALFSVAMAACESSIPGATPRVTPTVSPSSSPESVLAALMTQTTIGSTVDPGPDAGAGDQNPYGLAIAPTTAGKITAGDLVMCNFSDAANVPGTGTTIVGLHPTVGSSPYPIAQDSSLQGCDALSIDPNDNLYASAFVSNLDPVFTSAGVLTSTNVNAAWSGPFGQIYSPTTGTFGTASVFESNANNGTLARINLKNGLIASVDVIATGFTPNTGVPGAILGASGLAYDPNGDTLYVVDGGTNRLLAFAGASNIPANGVIVGASEFTGPSAASARVVFSGAPINSPISAAMLYNGNIVIGNTGDNNLIEVSSRGVLLDKRLVDTGAPGAIFGIVATGTSLATQRIYFNDENVSAVVSLSE
jgi:hypothetical protein